MPHAAYETRQRWHMIGKRNVLRRYVTYAVALVFLMTASFFISSYFLIRRLETAYREKIRGSFENAVQYVIDRQSIYMNIANRVLMDGSSEYLSLHRGKYNYQLVDSIYTIRNVMSTIRISNPEISDFVVWYDNLDFCVNTKGSHNKKMLAPLFIPAIAAK